jgi:hypothetical protein
MQSKKTAFEQQMAQTQQMVSQMQTMLQQIMYGNGNGLSVPYPSRAILWSLLQLQ